MSSQYKDNRSKLSTMLKSEPVKTPIQEVRPVQPLPATAGLPAVREELHINFWIPQELMKRLKVYAATSGKTIKEVGIKALENYLDNI